MAEHRGIEERIQAASRARVAQQVGGWVGPWGMHAGGHVVLAILSLLGGCGWVGLGVVGGRPWHREGRIRAAGRARVSQEVCTGVGGLVCNAVWRGNRNRLKSRLLWLFYSFLYSPTDRRPPPPPTPSPNERTDHPTKHNRWRPSRGPTRRGRWRGCCTCSGRCRRGRTRPRSSRRSRRRSKGLEAFGALAGMMTPPPLLLWAGVGGGCGEWESQEGGVVDGPLSPFLSVALFGGGARSFWRRASFLGAGTMGERRIFTW